jgi:hypothetical protein
MPGGTSGTGQHAGESELPSRTPRVRDAFGTGVLAVMFVCREWYQNSGLRRALDP